MALRFSVIVPAYNEEANLDGLLHTLDGQDFPAHGFEVILADNGSTDKTVALAREAGVRLVQETAIPQADAARNRAAAVARGEILVFTDADCRPSPTWLSELDQAFEAPASGAVGGRVRFTFASTPTGAQIYDSLAFLNHANSIPNRGIAFTANLAVAAETFRKLGGFPQDKYSGDSHFTAKLSASGFPLRYSPHAVVEHPARRFWDLMRKARRLGWGVATGPYGGTRRRSKGISARLLALHPGHMSRAFPQLNLRRHPGLVCRTILAGLAAHLVAAFCILEGRLRPTQGRRQPS